ncbi:fimbrial protein [Silvania hatchlandensis]|uniref:Type 1 fimbrial protein n=1 Tax=Silvania hatchlandensis TaxID=2926469 RepID=A0A9J6Q7T5_9ENTR|nr:fimbrial protein [Silvania hatchlandensis]MCU6666291.1 type 1 fimbrial protein [Silvania hatchlandensis]
MLKFTNTTSLLALIISSAFITATSAADGIITINGKITDTTCTISVNGDNKDTTVTLPTVSSTSLSAIGQTAGTTPFNISLSNCSGASLRTASTYFEPGTYVDNENGRLNVDSTADDAATNVQVQLLNSNMNPIVVGASVANGQNDVPIDISGGNGVLNYYAQYYATGSSQAGAVTTQVDYTMIYE